MKQGRHIVVVISDGIWQSKHNSTTRFQRSVVSKLVQVGERA